MLADKVRRADRAATRKMTLAQLVQAMEEPATPGPARATDVLPHDLRGDRRAEAAATLRAALGDAARLAPSRRAPARPRQATAPTSDDAAVTLMDAWWPKLVARRVRAARWGRRPSRRLQGCSRSATDSRRLAAAPDFFDGWWGYVSKDLRKLFGPKPRGSLEPRPLRQRLQASAAALALQRSLRAALKVTPEQLYGGGDGACAANPQPSCFDQNRPAVTSGITLGPFPFQNRPTFQQVVTLTQRLGR